MITLGKVTSACGDYAEEDVRITDADEIFEKLVI